jgi:hypothetical protein
VPADDIGLDEGPRTVADRRDGFAGVYERPDKADRVGIDPPRVRVDGTSRQ